MLACASLALVLAVSDPPPREPLVLCGLSAAGVAELEAACGKDSGIVVRAVPANALQDVIAADQAAVVAAYGFPVPTLRAAVRAQLLAPLAESVEVEARDLLDAQRSAVPLFIDPVVVARGAAGDAAWQPTWDAVDLGGSAEALVFESPRPGTATAAWFAALSARDAESALERIARLTQAAGPNLVDDATAAVARVQALGPRAFAIVRRSDARRAPSLVFDDLAQAAVESPAVLLGCSLGFGASGVDPERVKTLLGRDLARRIADAEGWSLALPVDATAPELVATRRLLARTVDGEADVLTALAVQRHVRRDDGAEQVSEWFDVAAMVVLVGAVTAYLWRRRKADAAAG
ncbi:MAG: hypothetical protein JNL94_09375 [Planctomycetes bacterium]|nr:hypothetical protein [Planctomycetota bacterium]